MSRNQNQRGAWRVFAIGVSSIALCVAAIWGSQGSAQASLGRGKTVMVDAWFNSQQRSNREGHMVYFHYKWDDTTNTGFSLLAQIFHQFGAATDTLYSVPTLKALKAAQVYIIASPDIPSKNPHPHYMQAGDAQQVAEWVKRGGVLVLMDNDPANADIDHLDLLAERFGIHFNDVLSHHVVDKDIENGKILVSGDGPVFHHAHTLYMKDTCTISVTKPALAILTDKEQIVMAMARYGKGTAFAVVDPWLYNEYINGRNIPAEYDNYAAGEEWVRWVLEQVPTDRQKY